MGPNSGSFISKVCFKTSKNFTFWSVYLSTYSLAAENIHLTTDILRHFFFQKFQRLLEITICKWRKPHGNSNTCLDAFSVILMDLLQNHRSPFKMLHFAFRMLPPLYWMQCQENINWYERAATPANFSHLYHLKMPLAVDFKQILLFISPRNFGRSFPAEFFSP